MAKHLVDLDEEALSAAQAHLGTRTMKDTINEALRQAGRARRTEVAGALDQLSRLAAFDRDDAWR